MSVGCVSLEFHSGSLQLLMTSSC